MFRLEDYLAVVYRMDWREERLKFGNPIWSIRVGLFPSPEYCITQWTLGSISMKTRWLMPFTIIRYEFIWLSQERKQCNWLRGSSVPIRLMGNSVHPAVEDFSSGVEDFSSILNPKREILLVKGRGKENSPPPSPLLPSLTRSSK